MFYVLPTRSVLCITVFAAHQLVRTLKTPQTGLCVVACIDQALFVKLFVQNSCQVFLIWRIKNVICLVEQSLQNLNQQKH